MEKPAVPVYPIVRTAEKTSPVWINDLGLAVLIVAASVLFGFLPTFQLAEHLDYTWIKLIQITFFLLLGIVSAVFIEKHSFSEKSFNSKFLYSLFLVSLIFLALSGIYFFKHTGSVFLAVATASAFLLPFVVDQGWRSFCYALPASTSSNSSSKPWYTLRTSSKEKASVFLTGIPVQIVLPVKYEDRHKKIFNSLAPAEMKLGEFFDHFILLRNNNERQNIETTDPEQKPFGWAFYEARMGGLKKRRLDPEVNLEENDIRRNAMIIAERVVEEYERGSN